MSDIAELDRHRYLSLATFRRSGAEVQTPVWFVAVGDRLYVFTAGDSGKIKRLRHSSRARVAPCDARGRVADAWREATARVTDDAAIPPARAAFRNHILGDNAQDRRVEELGQVSHSPHWRSPRGGEPHRGCYDAYECPSPGQS